MTEAEFEGLKKHILSLRKENRAKEVEGAEPKSLRDMLTGEEVDDLFEFADSTMYELGRTKIKVESYAESVEQKNTEISRLRNHYEQAHPIWSVLVAFIQVPIMAIFGAILEHKFAFLSGWHIGHMFIGLSAFFGFILAGQAASRDDWNRRI